MATQLETLNMLLRLIGASPVNSLETSQPDAFNAQAAMKRARKKLMKRGWWFNVDYNIQYSPDDQGFIVLPKSITTIRFTNWDLAKRGTRVYDKANQTYIFTEVQTAINQISVLEWDDMPESAQEYCGYFAGYEFVRDEIEDPTKEQSLQTSAGISMLDLKKEDLSQGQYNIFQHRRISVARGGIRPYSRNNGRFFGDPDR